MFPNINRSSIQITSLVLMVLGLFFILATHYSLMGVSLIVTACWVMLISESVLLTKVQSEMGTALEALRKKQEIEVQDLLFYLRQSELGNSPWSNVEAAKNHIQKIGFPAIITDSGGACVAINKAFTATLGYDQSIIGKLCHGFHRSDLYGEYVQGIAINIGKGNRFMHSRLTMINSDGEEYTGTVAIIMLPDMRTAVGIWYPDILGILKTRSKD